MQDVLKNAFIEQALACDALGSGFTARLMRALPEALSAAPQLQARLDGIPGDPGPRGASLPLRLAGGLHYLHLSGQEPALQAAWPPQGDGMPAPLLPGVLARHQAWLADWVTHAPQTNEVGRSAVLIAGAAWVAARTGLPLQVSELGASAGLNLNFFRYGLQVGGAVSGDAASPLQLRPDWRGPAPHPGAVPVVEARGVDLNPLSAQDDALRLLAYVWPDQAARLARMRQALEIARTHPPQVDKADAADWLEARLQAPWPGRCHLVCHTIAHQYFPPASQARIAAAMEQAGARASAQAPLAWLGMEGDAVPGSAGLTLRLWPGDQRLSLGRAGYHGQSVDWAG